jgi:hypothetical protein
MPRWYREAVSARAGSGRSFPPLSGSLAGAINPSRELICRFPVSVLRPSYRTNAEKGKPNILHFCSTKLSFKIAL